MFVKQREAMIFYRAERPRPPARGFDVSDWHGASRASEWGV
jgi:hypothetical protein